MVVVNKTIFQEPAEKRADATMDKEHTLAIRYFQEAIRNGQVEQYSGCMTIVFEVVLKFLAASSVNGDSITVRTSFYSSFIFPVQKQLYNILKWHDNQIMYYKEDPAKFKKSTEGVQLLAHLQRALQNKQPQPSSSSALGKEAKLANSSGSNAQGDDSIKETMTSVDVAIQQILPQSSGFSKGPLSDDDLEDATAQHSVRFLFRTRNRRYVSTWVKVEKFEPQFPSLEDSDDDDDNSFRVDEEREERAEKHGAKTCVEQVENRPDGSRSTTRRTRTVNVQQTSKSVTIRKHGGGAGEFMKQFTDGSHAFNDDSDFESSDVFSRPFGLRSGGLQSMKNFGFPEPSGTTSTSTEASDNLHTTTKSIQHSTDSVQSVARQAKRNGKIIADDAAHKVDTSELNAKQVERFKDSNLLTRQGQGTYEEGSVVREGLPDLNAPPVLPPKKRHVVQYMQTFGNGAETSDDTSRNSTLSSYVVLIDNLKYHEEQYSKERRAEYGAVNNEKSGQRGVGNGVE
ncbi:hypothetical protein L596_003272 [Steinernema carpocapsae]|uniref:Uncharacterized protein n=1 Tax=Steinernema carpocapsae TaxID=34508 RepID=A0A4U8UUY0_STECR|nr:hypothetical protein L596_003272 [Steinernema carpocapsae]